MSECLSRGIVIHFYAAMGFIWPACLVCLILPDKKLFLNDKKRPEETPIPSIGAFP